MGLIASKIFVIFVYLAVGFVCNKIGVLPDESNKHLTALMLYISSPCLMISAVNDQTILDGMVFNTVMAFVITLVIFIIVSNVMLRVNRKMRIPDGNELAICMTAPNVGFMGFPITLSLFGNLAGYYVIIASMALNVYNFVVSLPQYHFGEVRADSAEKRTFKEIVKPFINIVTIVSLLVIIMLFAEIHIPAYPISIIKSIGDMTVPLSMMITGIQLGKSKLGGLFSNKRLMFTSFVRLLAVPALTLGIMCAVPLDNTLKISLVSAEMFPTAVVTVALAANEGKNSKITAEAVALTTLLSMLTISFWAFVMTKLFL